jgi:type I restriction enzyme M protein
LAKINLALRGIIAHLGKAEDTFKNDQHPNLQIDYAISNPPYGLEGYFRNLDDNRWVLGVPPLGKVGANLA